MTLLRRHALHRRHSTSFSTASPVLGSPGPTVTAEEVPPPYGGGTGASGRDAVLLGPGWNELLTAKVGTGSNAKVLS